MSDDPAGEESTARPRRTPPERSPAAVSPRGERGSGGLWPMAERSLLPSVLGLPPVAAVGMAAAFTVLGVAVDLLLMGTLGMVFTICFVAGSVLAVAWVRRSGLFGPMVQPPLLVAVAVPAVVLLSGAPEPGAGIAKRLIVIGAPLVNAFPVTASATGLALAIGVFRLVTQRPVSAATRASSVTERQEPAAGEAREAARTSRSPRRS